MNPNPKLAPTLSPTLSNIAWAAGIFEGEGNVDRRGSSKPGVGIRVVVTQKDPWLLHQLRALFGGFVTYHGRNTVYLGKDYGIHRWHLTGARGRGFMLTIFAFLSPRRRVQARAALGC